MRVFGSGLSTQCVFLPRHCSGARRAPLAWLGQRLRADLELGLVLSSTYIYTHTYTDTYAYKYTCTYMQFSPTPTPLGGSSKTCFKTSVVSRWALCSFRLAAMTSSGSVTL